MKRFDPKAQWFFLLRTASVARYYGRMRAGVRLAALTKRKNDLEGQSRGAQPTELRRKQLHRRHSYLGRHNFISYAHRAARTMDQQSIRSQVKPHWKKFQAEVAKALTREARAK